MCKSKLNFKIYNYRVCFSYFHVAILNINLPPSCFSLTIFSYLSDQFVRLATDSGMEGGLCLRTYYLLCCHGASTWYSAIQFMDKRCQN